jgi:hypothetical protein
VLFVAFERFSGVAVWRIGPPQPAVADMNVVMNMYAWDNYLEWQEQSDIIVSAEVSMLLRVQDGF